MRIMIHWSRWTVEYRRYAVEWAEYSFAPLAEETRRESPRMRCFRRASTAVPVEVPLGSVVLRDPAGRERLMVYQANIGQLCCCAVAGLCQRGERGFGMAKEEM